MSIRWNFPLNNDGGIEGLNDAGVETFSGKLYHSLGKEILQNSLDAAVSGAGPVTVEFELIEIPKEDIPGTGEFKKIIEACLDFWREEQNREPYKFFQRAEKILSGDKIKVLKISDYNTTGLLDPGVERGVFNSLVKDSGRSNKGDLSGGSFGIGKNANFACSELRMVFFNTKDINGRSGFQGVSRLASHRNEKGTTRNTGYYGHSAANAPLTGAYEIPENYLRKEAGTDIFIAGFNEQEGWKKELISSIAGSFFKAVLDDRLRVKISGESITKDTLPEIMEKYFTDEDLEQQFYKAVSAEESEHKAVFREENFKEMGAVELHVLKNPLYKKRAAVVRSNGMRIVSYDRFQGAAPFSAVLLIKGEELNRFLRKCENPSHDSFEPLRYKEDPKKAEKILKELRAWTGRMIKNLFLDSLGEKIDVKGTGQYLNSFQNVTGEIRKQETLKKEVRKASIRKGKKKPKEENEKTDPKPRTGTSKKFKFIKKRIIFNDREQRYSLFLQGTRDARCFIKLNILTEDSSKEPAKIKKAEVEKKSFLFKTKEKVDMDPSQERIGPLELKADSLTEIMIHLEEEGKFAMEVLADYEISE